MNKRVLQPVIGSLFVIIYIAMIAIATVVLSIFAVFQFIFDPSERKIWIRYIRSTPVWKKLSDVYYNRNVDA